jgi:hypothetical protein
MQSALNPVQDVEVMLAEEVSWVVSDFYTEFSTGVLKSSSLNTNFDAHDRDSGQSPVFPSHTAKKPLG